MDLKSKIILISGPTAAGKSNFSIKLAKKVNGEIINADSMQIYKELKILSARPSTKDYQKIKIKSVKDLEKIVKDVLKSNQKTILLAIYNNENQRRYIGIKLD